MNLFKKKKSELEILCEKLKNGEDVEIFDSQILEGLWNDYLYLCDIPEKRVDADVITIAITSNYDNICYLEDFSDILTDDIIILAIQGELESNHDCYYIAYFITDDFLLSKKVQDYLFNLNDKDFIRICESTNLCSLALNDLELLNRITEKLKDTNILNYVSVNAADMEKLTDNTWLHLIDKLPLKSFANLIPNRIYKDRVILAILRQKVKEVKKYNLNIFMLLTDKFPELLDEEKTIKFINDFHIIPNFNKLPPNIFTNHFCTALIKANPFYLSKIPIACRNYELYRLAFNSLTNKHFNNPVDLRLFLYQFDEEIIDKILEKWDKDLSLKPHFIDSKMNSIIPILKDLKQAKNK